MSTDKPAPPDQPSAAPTRLRPTVIAGPAPKDRTAAIVPVQAPVGAAPVVAAPTTIPGVQRRRIEARPADLRKLSPGVAEPVVDRAVRLLATVSAEGCSDRTAVLWGHALQQQYSDLVSETVALSDAQILVKATGYVHRMIDILSMIDLQAVIAAPAGASIIGQYFKTLNTRIDTPQELEHARGELDQLVKLMGNALEPLLTLKDQLQAQSRGIDAISVEVEAAALAAQYLSSHFAPKRPDLSQRFLERAMSLTQTVAQIRGTSTLRGAQTEQPLALIAAIQTVALVSVPSWLGTVAAMTLSLRNNQRPTHTEAGELNYRLRTILQQLKA